MNKIKNTVYCLTAFLLLNVAMANAQLKNNDLTTSISLKTPGNAAVNYPLSDVAEGSKSRLESGKNIPVTITREVKEKIVTGESDFGQESTLKVTVTANEDIFFNLRQQLSTGFTHSDCLFLMPGFWYRHNLRSPKEAPSFHTSDSWTVREDRLSTPLTGIYNEKTGTYVSVLRDDDFKNDALTTHTTGEVIISGKTSIGYTGFENKNGQATLSFGFPYRETPKTYIRKLTLIDPVEAFQYLKKGESITLIWKVKKKKASDFSDFVKQTWEYAFDTFNPQLVETGFSTDFAKETLTGFFKDSYVDKFPLKFYSGEGLEVATCRNNGRAEIGFVGRVLLNGFNALEYGQQKNRTDLVTNANAVYDSYLQHGFTPNGFMREFVNFDAGNETDVYSIRRQSEGIYAVLRYLQYEKENGKKHAEWEGKMKNILDKFLLLQNSDGSFPRKFKDDMSVVDASGGSTPSATLPLVMAYKYFNNKKYLEAAKKTADYLDKEIISKADYFSSTLDANCEDKEASFYASLATYYLALVTKGNEQQRYADLSRKSAYFALSWYYTWDVPFSRGQMIGDIGLKTRGWGNVSVENNHIDVFIFEYASVLNWLSKQYNEPRFSAFMNVISSSMLQLLPFDSHMCGIAKAGYYPEVVQHTNWDYGRNGKGYYNDIFAPGWTVASLWELLSPGRAEKFLK